MLEGVGYGINQHFEIFDTREMGTQKVMAVGGGVKNPVWLKIISDISGKTQHLAQVETGASYGDALLAALGAGYYKDAREVTALIREKGLVEPDPAARATYAPNRCPSSACYIPPGGLLQPARPKTFRAPRRYRIPA